MYGEARFGDLKLKRGMDFASIWMNALGCYHTQIKLEAGAKKSEAPDVPKINFGNHVKAYETLDHYMS